MHSHVSVVYNKYAEYIHSTTAEQFKRLHEEGTISLGLNAHFSGIRDNTTAMKSFTVAGEIYIDGKCQGTQFSDSYGTWNDVIVQAKAKISLKSEHVPIRIESEKYY